VRIRRGASSRSFYVGTRIFWILNYLLSITQLIWLDASLKLVSLARWLRQSFFSDALRSYENIHIIAHSMGGLVARSIYIQDRLGGASKIRSIVSIASTYLGAKFSELAAELGISKDLTEDIAPDSEFIKTLEDNWTDTNPKPLTYCFTSPADWIVSSLSAKR
jgi:pimeloyl-ACP methyl ester carboxylesterase